jgi:murein DD-endopeptidase MepM/ murein hydrolase activator NlpD
MKKLSITIIIMLLLGFIIPQNAVIPVQNATNNDWNPYSYWYFPWGESGVHKGIDIFGKLNTPVISSVSGLVVFTGNLKKGGNVVAILGPKWRIHYFAHLNTIDAHKFSWVNKGEKIGKLGNTGNAASRPAHLHYSVISPIPNPIEFTTETQGWKRMFYISPNNILR